MIPHLGGGGAEQVAALLARGLSARKYEVHLGLMTQGLPAPESMPPAIFVHALGASRVRTGTVALLRLIRRVKPDVVLSGMTHLNFLVLLLRPFLPRRTRVLVRQDCTVSDLLAQGNLPIYTRMLYRRLYPRADRVLCQSRAMAADLAAELDMPESSLAILPNPVEVDEIRAAVAMAAAAQSEAAPGTRVPHLLAAGRLVRQKGFDLLLTALATVRVRFPELRLTIAGAGQQEAALKAQCRALSLESAVDFPGRISDLAARFASATLFVLSSRYEGMPNALLEAAAAGLPLVSLPASGGVVDLLGGQPGAWMASAISSPALADSLLTALETLRPGERFPHPFIEAFRAERALAAYESLIDATLAERRR